MRATLVIVGLWLLGACNMVITQQPVFAAPDAGPLQLRPGVWRMQADRPCRFAEARSITRWPECAQGFLVMSDRIRTFDIGPKGKRTVADLPYVLSGAPQSVMQLLPQKSDAKDAEAADPDGPTYVYVGLRPTATDAKGLVTAFKGWSVLCGAPPPGGSLTSDGKNPRYGSLDPLPGLTMDAQENNCSTTSKSALRDAATASEKWLTPSAASLAHWVRDGDR